MVGIAPAKLEGHAAEDEPEQHGGERCIKRGQDDRIGKRKGGEQPAAAEHQPGLIAVPNGRNGVHRLIALLAELEQREENADAEIKAIHHHISGNGKGDQEGPDDGEIHGVLVSIVTRAQAGDQWDFVIDREARVPSWTPASAGVTTCYHDEFSGLLTAADGVMPALRMGAFTGSASPSRGGLAIRRRIYQVPAAKTAK